MKAAELRVEDLTKICIHITADKKQTVARCYEAPVPERFPDSVLVETGYGEGAYVEFRFRVGNDDYSLWRVIKEYRDANKWFVRVGEENGCFRFIGEHEYLLPDFITYCSR